MRSRCTPSWMALRSEQESLRLISTICACCTRPTGSPRTLRASTRSAAGDRVRLHDAGGRLVLEPLPRPRLCPARLTGGRAIASSLGIWLMAARPRRCRPPSRRCSSARRSRGRGIDRLIAFVAAMLGALFIQVGTNLSNDYSDARRGADTEDRLGPGARDRRRARAAAPGARRDLPELRRRRALRRLPDRRRRPGAAADRRRVDPRGHPLHRRAAPVRLRGPRRGLRLPLLRRRRRHRLVLRAAPGRCPGRRSCSPCRSACSPPRSSSSTTCATSTPTGAPASARSRCGSGASARGRSTRRCSLAAYLDGRRCRGSSARCRPGCCCRG